MKLTYSALCFIIFPLFIILCGCAQSSNNQNQSTQTQTGKKLSDREHEGFTGKVKKVVVKWSPLSGSSIPFGSECPSRTDVYDENGRLNQHSVFSGVCGTSERREDYVYSQDGSRLVKPNSDNTEERKTIFKYDSSGRRSEQIILGDNGETLSKYVYRYDEKGRMTEMADYESDGKIINRRVYDFKGDERFPSGFTYIGWSGKVDERTLYSDYEFNPHGDWIKRKETTEEMNRKSVSFTLREIEYY